jgi:HAD superfamily hydrolase (TIGR01549 family)
VILKVVVLDFDGIVLESCDIKTVAFRKLFEDYPESVDEIVNYHLEHMGVSRYKKFKYFYEHFLKKTLKDEELQELGNKFSELVLEEIKTCTFVSGALNFLNNYSKKFSIYVASGTPEPELQMIVKERGLEGYFKGVYGAPATKSEILNRIVKKENVEKRDVVFVGDSQTDFKEALKAEIPFIYRARSSTDFRPDPKNCLGVINNLTALNELIG